MPLTLEHKDKMKIKGKNKIQVMYYFFELYDSDSYSRNLFTRYMEENTWNVNINFTYPLNKQKCNRMSTPSTQETNWIFSLDHPTFIFWFQFCLKGDLKCIIQNRSI